MTRPRKRSRLSVGIAVLALITAACGSVAGANRSTTTSHPATPAHPLATSPTSPHPTTGTTKPPESVRPDVCPERWAFDSPSKSLNDKRPRPGLSKTLVPGGPTSLTVCRYSGLNQKVKPGTLERSRVVTGAALEAFVKYVDEPTWQTVNPHTTYMCPMSTGLVDLLQFVYPSGSPVLVSLEVDGCSFASNGYRTVWGGSIGARITAWVGRDSLPPS